MNIETARRIVADSSLAPSQADWMLAGRVLYDHWQRHPEELRPGEAGRLTYDAATPRRESSAAAVASVRALTARIDKLSKRRTLTRDQDPARKLMQLPGHAAAYRVATDSDGKVWLEQLEGAQTGKPPPAADPDLMEADPPLKMGPTLEVRPGAPPRLAALPPGVTRARRVGEEPEPPPIMTPDMIPPPQPPPMSEVEARTLLTELQQAEREADAASDAAQAALHRAQQHAEACAAELAAFADIDTELRQLHVEALRSGDIRPQIVVPPELRQRLAERDAAKVALDAATSAVPVFAKEAEHARQEATDARLKLSNAADLLVARHALTLLRERAELARELETRDRDLLAFEQFASPRPPRAIAEFAMEIYGAGRRVALLDASEWRGLHQRLVADPAAELELRPSDG
jgi:hypothetical protein